MIYSVIEADLEKHKNHILMIWARNLPPLFHGDLSEYTYSWYYQENPCGPGRCWLLRENKTGQFVGTAGLGLRRFKLLNQPVLAGLLADFAIDQEHRVFLPALTLQKKVREMAEPELGFLYSLPTRPAASVLLRAGHRKLGELQRYARILKVRTYVERALGGVPGARALAPPLDWVLKTVYRDTWGPVSESFVVRPIDEFDSRFDALWERAAPNFSVVAERTSQFLRWRYTLFPWRKFSTLGLMSRDERRLFGYVVYYFQKNVIFVSDLFFEDDDKILSNLLNGFLRFARKTDAISISLSFLGAERIIKRLRLFGFYPRSDTKDVIIAAGAKNLFPSVALDKSNWYLVSGDEEY